MCDDRARLDRVLSVVMPALAPLDPADAEWALRRFLPPVLANAAQRAQRDGLIIAELGRMQGPNATAKACDLERRLRRAAAGCGDETASAIVRLSGGRAIGWKAICKIEFDRRTIRLNRDRDAHGERSRSAP